MFFPRSKARNRRFTYEPRYYDPTRDDNIRQRLRIKRRAVSRRRPPLRLLVILALLVLALYIFLSL